MMHQLILPNPGVNSLWDNQVIISKADWQHILEVLHNSRHGMSRMKERARIYGVVAQH